MEREIESKIFYLNKYQSKKDMEIEIKEYIKKLKFRYPESIVTKEFYEGTNILVRATIINNNNYNKEMKKENNLELGEKEEVRIKEKGINGLGENVDRTRENNHGGSERERGGR